MKKYLFVTGLLAAGLLNVYSCGGSSSGGGGDGEEASTANTGAAVASVFGMGSDESISAELLHAIARQVGDDEEDMEEGDGDDGPEGAGERNTCDDPDGNNEADGPEEIDTPLTGTAGTYGNTAAAGGSTTVTDDDFCVGSDGAENEGDDLFASFTLRQTVTGTCTDDTTVSMTAGTGIWRNTDDCFPEIFGGFTMNGNDCDVHICMNEDQSVGSDSSVACGGEAVSVNTDVECTISADGGEDDEDTGDDEEMGEDDEDTDGDGGPMGEDEEDT